MVSGSSNGKVAQTWHAARGYMREEVGWLWSTDNRLSANLLHYPANFG